MELPASACADLCGRPCPQQLTTVMYSSVSPVKRPCLISTQHHNVRQSESLRSAALGLRSLCWQCSVNTAAKISLMSSNKWQISPQLFFFFPCVFSSNRKITGMSSVVDMKATLKTEIFPTGLCIFQQLMVKISFSRSPHILLKTYDREMQTQIAVRRCASHTYLPAGMCVCKYTLVCVYMHM